MGTIPGSETIFISTRVKGKPYKMMVHQNRNKVPLINRGGGCDLKSQEDDDNSPLITTSASLEEIEEKWVLQKIRELIKNCDNELLSHNTWEFTDDFLLRYLRGRGYDLESAFERLAYHMHVRRKVWPCVFARLYPSAIRDALEIRTTTILKGTDRDGCGVMYCRPGIWDPKVVSVDHYCMGLMMMGWELLQSRETQLHGIVILVDGQGFSLSHVRQGTFHIVQKYTGLIVKASPFKFKAAHIVLAPTIANITINLVKFFLPPKMRKRIHVHGNNTSVLHKYLSPDVLPVGLGGSLPSEEDAIDGEWMDYLSSPEREEYYKVFTG